MRQRFVGSVFTGSGEGSFFTSMPWFKEFVQTNFDLGVFPGTLNLRAQTNSDISVLNSIRSSKSGYALKSPDARYCSAKLYLACVRGIKGVVVFPEIREYPGDVCEIVSNVSLRETLSLADGELAEVEIEV